MIPSNFPYTYSGNVELFDYYASVSIATTVTALVLEKIVPPNFGRGFITQIGIGIDDPSAFSTSIFRVKVNNAGCLYYSDIRDQIAPFSDPRDMSPIPFNPNDTLQVEVTNNGAATRLYAARLRGFFDYAYGSKV